MLSLLDFHKCFISDAGRLYGAMTEMVFLDVDNLTVHSQYGTALWPAPGVSQTFL